MAMRRQRIKAAPQFLQRKPATQKSKKAADEKTNNEEISVSDVNDVAKDEGNVQRHDEVSSSNDEQIGKQNIINSGDSDNGNDQNVEDITKSPQTDNKEGDGWQPKEPDNTREAEQTSNDECNATEISGESDVATKILSDDCSPRGEAKEEVAEVAKAADNCKSQDPPVEAESSKDEDTCASTIPKPEIVSKSHDSMSISLVNPHRRKNDSDSFKCPPRVEKSIRPDLHHAMEGDAFLSDLEDSVMQQDLQRSAQDLLLSPGKSRPRMRPTPVIGQRRNSFLAPMSPSPHTNDENASVSSPASSVDYSHGSPNTRRERHYSNSFSPLGGAPSTPSHQPSASMWPFHPGGGSGRTRTESNCSAFSDTYAPSMKSVRKTEEHLAVHRVPTRREFETRFSNGVPDKTTLKMYDLIFYNPETNPMARKPTNGVKQEQQIKTEPPDTKEGIAKIETPSEPSTTNPSSPSSTSAQSMMPVPQLKLNANGELILDDKSLEIETTAEQEARKMLAKSSLIFLDENTGMNGFYRRKKRTKDWQPDETIRFYRSLQTIGTDFSLMVDLFPGRTRRDLKLKFKKEERCNDALINKALLSPKTFNVEELKRQLEAEDREREETARRWKEIKERETKVIKKEPYKRSRGARDLKNADDIYDNEHVVKTKFSSRQYSKASTSNTLPSESKPKRRRRAKVKAPDVGKDGEGNQGPQEGDPSAQVNAIKKEEIGTEDSLLDKYLQQADYAMMRTASEVTLAASTAMDVGHSGEEASVLEHELTELLSPNHIDEFMTQTEVASQEPPVDRSHALDVTGSVTLSPPGFPEPIKPNTSIASPLCPSTTSTTLTDLSTGAIIIDERPAMTISGEVETTSLLSDRTIEASPPTGTPSPEQEFSLNQTSLATTCAVVVTDVRKMIPVSQAIQTIAGLSSRSEFVDFELNTITTDSSKVPFIYYPPPSSSSASPPSQSGDVNTMTDDLATAPIIFVPSPPDEEAMIGDSLTGQTAEAIVFDSTTSTVTTITTTTTLASPASTSSLFPDPSSLPSISQPSPVAIDEACPSDATEITPNATDFVLLTTSKDDNIAAAEDNDNNNLSSQNCDNIDLQQLMDGLAEGTLYFVSALDDEQNNANEIFAVDRETGELCDEPLNVPRSIIEMLSAVMR